MALSVEHQRFCLQSSLQLDRHAERHQTKEVAEIVLAKVRTGNIGTRDPSTGIIEISRSDLTSAFCNNPGRPGSIKTQDLYFKVIPELIQLGECSLLRKVGKSEIYGFQPGS